MKQAAVSLQCPRLIHRSADLILPVAVLRDAKKATCEARCKCDSENFSMGRPALDPPAYG